MPKPIDGKAEAQRMARHATLKRLRRDSLNRRIDRLTSDADSPLFALGLAHTRMLNKLIDRRERTNG